VTALTAFARRTLLRGFAAAVAGTACDRIKAAPLEPRRAAPPPPRLTAGVNLGNWFQFAQREAPSDAQLEGLRRAGIDHVRLPVDPHALDWRPEAGPGQAPFARLDGLDRAVNRLVAHGLFVNLDVQPGPEVIGLLQRNQQRLQPLLAPALAALVRRYAHHGEHRICFELMNEPHRFCPAGEWNALQGRLIAQLRGDAGGCWLVANGGWDPITTLRTIDVYDDPRVLYAFHFYKPYVVTHQGARWEPAAARLLPFLDHVPYPSDKLDVAAARFKPGGDRRYLAGELQKYKDEGWGAERIRREIDTVVAWRAKNQAPIFCTEFGVMRPNIDQASRLRWLGDVARALTDARVPWTVWDYCTPEFGVARCGAGETVLEPEAAQALGLRPLP
jgi:endoglucanase